jgi:Helix-turn-helix domain
MTTCGLEQIAHKNGRVASGATRPVKLSFAIRQPQADDPVGEGWEMLRPKARWLWRAIRLLSKNTHGYCWAGQDRLANYLHISERNLQRYLNELKEAGFCRWERHGHNHYFAIYPAPANATKNTTDNTTENTTVSGPLSCSVSGSVSCSPPGAPLEELRKCYSSSSKEAAAAAAPGGAPENTPVPAPTKPDDEVQALVRFGMDENLAKSHVSQDRALVKAAISHFQAAFTDTKNPIHHPVPFMIKILENAARYGFVREGLTWRPPPGRPREGTTSERLEARINRNQAEQERMKHRFHAADQSLDQNRATWNAIPQAERAELLAEARKNPLNHKRNDSDIVLITAALRVRAQRIVN